MRGGGPSDMSATAKNQKSATTCSRRVNDAADSEEDTENHLGTAR